MNKAYQMSEEKSQEMLMMSRDYVPFGIYAVKKDNQIELLNQKASSTTQLKHMIREYKSQGFKVYSNGL